MLGCCGRLYKLYLDAELRRRGYDVTPAQSSALIYLYKCREESITQRDLEKARGTTDRFSTRNFDTGSGLDWKNKSFAGASKEFNTGKTAYDKRSNSMFSRDMQPDFMNESHGISHSDRYLSTADNRSSAEGRISETSSYYISETAPFSTGETDHYFESRRDKAGQPVIIDHREYYKKHRQGIRELLGRDNVPL